MASSASPSNSRKQPLVGVKQRKSDSTAFYSSWKSTWGEDADIEVYADVVDKTLFRGQGGGGAGDGGPSSLAVFDIFEVVKTHTQDEAVRLPRPVRMPSTTQRHRSAASRIAPTLAYRSPADTYRAKLLAPPEGATEEEQNFLRSLQHNIYRKPTVVRDGEREDGGGQQVHGSSSNGGTLADRVLKAQEWRTSTAVPRPPRFSGKETEPQRVPHPPPLTLLGFPGETVPLLHQQQQRNLTSSLHSSWSSPRQRRTADGGGGGGSARRFLGSAAAAPPPPTAAATDPFPPPQLVASSSFSTTGGGRDIDGGGRGRRGLRGSVTAPTRASSARRIVPLRDLPPPTAATPRRGSRLHH